MLDSASALQALGVDVVVVFLSDGPMVEQSLDRGLDATVVPLHPSALRFKRQSAYLAAAWAAPYTAGAARRLGTFLTRRRIDLLETNSMKAHVVGALAARLANVACVWRLRDIASPPHLSSAEAAAIRVVARMADAIVAVSGAAGETVRHPRVIVEPSAIRTERFTDIAPLPLAPPSPLRVACISRLAAWKGQDIVISAVRELKSRLPIEVVVAGGALFGEEAYGEALQREAPSSVRFIGHVSDVVPVIAGAHVIAHTPRMPEPFGKVVVEAMAAGRIAIAARGAGPTEILGAEFPRWLLSAPEPELLASKFLEIVGDWNAYIRDAQRAKAVAARYDVQGSAERSLEIYQSVLAAAT